MKVRIPNQGGVHSDMMKIVQQMQEDMQNKQAELEAAEYDVTSGGGMVKITISGAKEIKALKIDPSVVDPEDVEMLEDLIVAAVNEAINKVEQPAEEEPAEPETVTMKVSASSVNVRSEASTDSSIVTKVTNGETVEVVGDASQEWVQIRCTEQDGKEGYVKSEFLTAAE